MKKVISFLLIIFISSTVLVSCDKWDKNNEGGRVVDNIKDIPIFLLKNPFEEGESEIYIKYGSNKEELFFKGDNITGLICYSDINKNLYYTTDKGIYKIDLEEKKPQLVSTFMVGFDEQIYMLSNGEILEITDKGTKIVKNESIIELESGAIKDSYITKEGNIIYVGSDNSLNIYKDGNKKVLDQNVKEVSGYKDDFVYITNDGYLKLYDGDKEKVIELGNKIKIDESFEVMTNQSKVIISLKPKAGCGFGKSIQYIVDKKTQEVLQIQDSFDEKSFSGDILIGIDENMVYFMDGFEYYDKIYAYNLKDNKFDKNNVFNNISYGTDRIYLSKAEDDSLYEYEKSGLEKSKEDLNIEYIYRGKTIGINNKDKSVYLNDKKLEGSKPLVVTDGLKAFYGYNNLACYLENETKSFKVVDLENNEVYNYGEIGSEYRYVLLMNNSILNMIDIYNSGIS